MSSQVTLSGLPRDLIIGIFSNLDAKDRARCAIVCKTFNECVKAATSNQKIQEDLRKFLTSIPNNGYGTIKFNFSHHPSIQFSISFHYGNEEGKSLPTQASVIQFQMPKPIVVPPKDAESIKLNPFPWNEGNAHLKEMISDTVISGHITRPSNGTLPFVRCVILIKNTSSMFADVFENSFNESIKYEIQRRDKLA